MTTGVLCYGGICIDNIIHVPYMPTAGVATTPTHQQFQLGGGATLTAVWLAQWGVNVGLSGNAIGKDDYGTQILAAVKNYPSFSSDLIQQSEVIDTPYTRAIVPPNGDRYLIEFGYDVAPMVQADNINLDTINILTVNFYYNNPEQESQKLAQQAHQKGIQVIASDILDEGNPFFHTSDIIINSRAVMSKIYPDVDHIEYIKGLQAKHGGTIILTDGDNKVWVFHRDESQFQVNVPTVNVHDTTGAGDAFRAGIVYGELHNWLFEESVKLAVATGTLQVKRNSATTPPASLNEAKAVAQTISVI